MYAKQVYEHLIKVNTIVSSTAPNAHIAKITAAGSTTDGFKLLFAIIKSNCPHLGGTYRDLSPIIDTWNKTESETIIEFYTRTLAFKNELVKRKDVSGSINKLTYRFHHVLYQDRRYCNYLHTSHVELEIFKRDIINVIKDPPHTIESIYHSLSIVAGIITPNNDLQGFPFIPSVKTITFDCQDNEDNECLSTPIINAARFNKETIEKSQQSQSNLRSNQNKSPSNSRIPYQNTSPLCRCCQLTKYKMGPLLASFHDFDKQICPFSDPSNIIDKRTRESVLQYKISHQNRRVPPPDANIPSPSNNHLSIEALDTTENENNDENIHTFRDYDNEIDELPSPHISTFDVPFPVEDADVDYNDLSLLLPPTVNNINITSRGPIQRTITPKQAKDIYE